MVLVSVATTRASCARTGAVTEDTLGLIETDISKGKLSAEKKAEIAQTIPLGRLGAAADVAGCCLFLASDLSAYCTGITLDVNGGMLIH